MFGNRLSKLLGGGIAAGSFIALTAVAIVYFSPLSEAENQDIGATGQSRNYAHGESTCDPRADDGIIVTKTPDTQTIDSGQTANFVIEVTNCGDFFDFTNVEVADALAPDCSDPNLGPLNHLDSVSYMCSLNNVTQNFVNTVIATGFFNGDQISDDDDAIVLVRPDVTFILETKLDAIEAKLDALEIKMDTMMEEPKCVKGNKINSLTLELTSVPAGASGPLFTIKAFDDGNLIATRAGIAEGTQILPAIVPAGGVKLFKKNDIKFTVLDEGNSLNQLTDGLKVHTSCSDSPVPGLTQDSKDDVTFTLVSFESVKK